MTLSKYTPILLLLFSSLYSAHAQTASAPLDAGDAVFRLNPDKSNYFAYKNNDEGQLSQTQVATGDNTVRGVYQYKHPETGPTRTEYTAGERGFRARGTDIARQMDLSQNKIPYNPPVDPNSPEYNPTYNSYHDPNEDPSYKFNIRTPTFVKDEVAGSQGQVQGSYTYTDDIGEVHRVDYEAGAGKGFRVKNLVPDNSQSGFYYGGPGVPPRGRTSVQQADDGSYTFVAQGPNTRRAEKRDNSGHVSGSYSYIDDKGVEKIVSYIAGPETGYQVVSKVPKEFIPLFQPGYIASVTPTIPFPTSFPSFPSPVFPSKKKVPTTTYAPLIPPSTTAFPSVQSPSPAFPDLFASPQPAGDIFSGGGGAPTSSSGGGYNNNGGSGGGYNNNGGSGGGYNNNGGSGGGYNNNGGSGGGYNNNGGSGGGYNSNANKNKPNTLFPTSSSGGSNDLNKENDFLGHKTNVFSPGSYGGGSTPSRPSTNNIRPSTNSANDFLRPNSVPNQIPLVSFPVDGPNTSFGDYSNICKVCRNLKDKSESSFYNQGYRPSYASENEFNGFSNGNAVRAHVQSIDLYPFGPRAPEPGEAIDSNLTVDRGSVDSFDREILYTTPSSNLISSFHSTRSINEFDRIKSDRIVESKGDFNEKNPGKKDEGQNIEASTYRGHLGTNESQKKSDVIELPDIFKGFNLLNNQTNQHPSSNSQQRNDVPQNSSFFNQNFDDLFQAPQKLKVESPDERLRTAGQGSNVENLNNPEANYQNNNFENHENVNEQRKNKEYKLNNETPQKHNAKIQRENPGPNLLELLQKEVRSRPIYVPDFPEEPKNNEGSFSSSQDQIKGFESSLFDWQSSTIPSTTPSTKARNQPRGIKRGRSKYMRPSHKDSERSERSTQTRKR